MVNMITNEEKQKTKQLVQALEAGNKRLLHLSQDINRAAIKINEFGIDMDILEWIIERAERVVGKARNQEKKLIKLYELEEDNQ